ncbi:MAG: hypothetical protein AAF488_12355, partial [Planctomycetota bacterium]
MAGRHIYAVIFFVTLAVVGFGVTLEPAASERARPERASWVWLGEPADNPKVYLRHAFVLGPDARAMLSQGKNAVLTATGDNSVRVYLNGTSVLRSGQWETPLSHEVSDQLQLGENVIAVEAVNEGGPAAVALSLSLGDQLLVVTDEQWRGATAPAPGWRGASESGSGWEPVDVVGPVGGEGLPWTDRVSWLTFQEAPLVEPVSLKPQQAKVDPALKLLPGFRGELVYTVTKEQQGSWVCLAVDDRGRIYASDQRDKGLFRVTPAPIGDP